MVFVPHVLFNVIQAQRQLVSMPPVLFNVMQAQQQLQQQGEGVAEESSWQAATSPKAGSPKTSPRALPRTATPGRGDLALQLPANLSEVGFLSCPLQCLQPCC